VTDVVDKATRSRMMAGIKGTDTKPERVLRSALHARGLRYRLHAKEIVGRPDLVFPKHHAVVFVHGCFWHRHEGCRYATTPATRPDFWHQKFGRNVARDQHVKQELLRRGWRVATVWECAVRGPGTSASVADQVEAWLVSGERMLDVT
jgi:DNA mismatch endonuclease (patch repair protein)